MQRKGDECMKKSYQCQLDFFLDVLQKLRLPARQLHSGQSIEDVDGGLRRLLGIETDYEAILQSAGHWMRERTIYRITDQFMCRYISFVLPEFVPKTLLVIGPYLTNDPSETWIMEQNEQLGIPAERLATQKEYYASLPVYNDPSIIMALLSTLGETLWGGADAFDMVDESYMQSVCVSANAQDDGEAGVQAEVLAKMQQLEERYQYENQMMEIVAKGMISRAEIITSNISGFNYQPRSADPLRNMKNYCIICNTILRKAAESGGVHPYYLDITSSQYARSIETVASMEKASQLIGSMVRGYCRLVRTHKSQHYSSVVQKAMTYIEANLSENLSLQMLASLIGVNSTYLSALFHQEVGVTLSAYIKNQRMKTALHLLQTTHLQIQTVAQISGFSDPNYFCKQFKRMYGETPQQYRKAHMATAAH